MWKVTLLGYDLTKLMPDSIGNALLILALASMLVGLLFFLVREKSLNRKLRDKIRLQPVTDASNAFIKAVTPVEPKERERLEIEMTRILKGPPE